MAAARSSRALALALPVGAAAALLGACSSGPSQQTAAPDTATAERDPVAAAAARAEAMYKEMGKDAGASRIDRSTRASSSSPRGRVLEAPPTSPSALPLQPSEPAAETPGPSPAANAPLEVAGTANQPVADAAPTNDKAIAPTHHAPADPAAQRRELVHQLAQSLAAVYADAPAAMNTALALAALEAADPAAATPALAAWQARLSPAQQATFSSLRDLYGKLPAATGTDSSDTTALATLLREQAAALQPSPGLSISNAALCRRVDGFGRYTTLNTTTLVAGRPQPVIVYVEPEGFAHRAADTPDSEQRWTVELSQELQLYHDADGTLAWMDREQNISESSRRQRRDFYLVRRIDLPATLSIGAYRLKVVVRDRVSGTVAESIIPMQVVADANLAGRPSRAP